MIPDENPLPGWVPTRFFRRDGRPMVEWCDLGTRRLAAPFFADTVRAARHAGGATRVTPADALGGLAGDEPTVPLAGMIFHLSRCGSTLVSQMLGALPSHVVVSEAAPLEEVLRAVAGAPDAGEQTRAGWLRGLVHAYGVGRFPEERRLFLKLDPWQVLDLEVIRAVFPKVPAVFVYRDPVEILMSLSDNVASTFTPTPEGAARLGLTFVEALSLSMEEYCARALGRIAGGAADAAARDPRWRLVNYTQLPEAVETVVAPWFGLTLDEEERETMRRVTRFHAKAPGRLVFKEDSARKQRDAEGEVRELAQRWVGPAYKRLEGLRSMPPPPPR